MSEHPSSSGQNPNSQGTKEAWREVGRQFQALGDSLSEAFRAAWTDENNRERVEEMRTGIESMVNQVGKVLKDYSNTPEGQQVRQEAKRAAENFRTAGEQTMTEARPHLVTALRQVNSELQRMIDQMDHSPRAAQYPEADQPTGDETIHPG
jgi:hypothetical protein